MAKKSGKVGVTNEKIMEVLLDMDERITGMDERMVTKEDLRKVLKDYPTKTDLADTVKDFAKKSDLEKFKEDILEEIRPIARAIDKDAVTIIDHGKRISVLERKVGVVTK